MVNAARYLKTGIAVALIGGLAAAAWQWRAELQEAARLAVELDQAREAVEAQRREAEQANAERERESREVAEQMRRENEIRQRFTDRPDSSRLDWLRDVARDAHDRDDQD